jgi:CheY-like chemotaxis protein
VPTVRAHVPATARILLVEDDPALRSALAEVLRERGYHVTCAADGRDALAQLDGEAPSVILLDLAMPVMDGWTFRAVQRRDPRYAAIPTVVLSASLSAADPRSLATLEPDAALSKPFEIERLIETVQRLCAA